MQITSNKPNKTEPKSLSANNPFNREIEEGQGTKQLSVQTLFHTHSYSNLNLRQVLLGLLNPYKCIHLFRGENFLNSLMFASLISNNLPDVQQYAKKDLKRLSENGFDDYLEPYKKDFEIFLEMYKKDFGILSGSSYRCPLENLQILIENKKLIEDLKNCNIGEMKRSFSRLDSCGLLNELYQKIPYAKLFFEFLMRIKPEYRESNENDITLIPDESSFIWLEHYLKIENIKLNSYLTLLSFISCCPKRLYNGIQCQTMYLINKEFLILNEKSTKQLNCIMLVMYDNIMSISTNFKEIDVLRLKIFERLVKGNFLDKNRNNILAQAIIENLHFFKKGVEYTAIRILCHLIENNLIDNTEKGILAVKENAKQWQSGDVMDDLIKRYNMFIEFLLIKGLINIDEGERLIETLFYLNYIESIYINNFELKMYGPIPDNQNRLAITSSPSSNENQVPQSSNSFAIEDPTKSSPNSTGNNRNKMLIMFFLVILLSGTVNYFLSSSN